MSNTPDLFLQGAAPFVVLTGKKNIA